MPVRSKLYLPAAKVVAASDSCLHHAQCCSCYPRAIVRSEEFYVNEKFNDASWDRTSDLPICSTAPLPRPCTHKYLFYFLTYVYVGHSILMHIKFLSLRFTLLLSWNRRFWNNPEVLPGEFENNR